MNNDIIIKYGIENNSINITDIVYKKCLKNNIIYIPSIDNERAKIFGDPLFNVLKSIFIYNTENKLIGEYDHMKDVYIDTIKNEIYTENPNCNTIIFTNARDEHNIHEWIAHHDNLGFDTIYILDHLSVIPIKHTIKENSKIIIERNNNEISGCNNKTNYVSNAINYSKKNNYDWMLYLDADEFLILKNHTNIKSFIQEYKEYDLIGLNWLMFGNNNYCKIPPGTILENYTKCEDNIDSHVKSLVKVNKLNNIQRCNILHNYDLIDPVKSVNIYLKKIENAPCHNLNKNYKDCHTYIAHYYIQSLDTYYLRKASRIDDDNVKRSFSHSENFASSNSSINFFPRDKYNQNNIKYMNDIINTIKIKRIKYGLDMEKSIDLTNEIIEKYLSNKILYITDTNFHLIKGDPYPYIHKKLFIEYEYEHKLYVIEYLDNIKIIYLKNISYL